MNSLGNYSIGRCLSDQIQFRKVDRKNEKKPTLNAPYFSFCLGPDAHGF